MLRGELFEERLVMRRIGANFRGYRINLRRGHVGRQERTFLQIKHDQLICRGYGSEIGLAQIGGCRCLCCRRATAEHEKPGCREYKTFIFHLFSREITVIHGENFR